MLYNTGGSLLRVLCIEFIRFKIICKCKVPVKRLEQGYPFREIADGNKTPQPVSLPLLEASLEVPFAEAV
jgi:hypothetical protein